VTHEKHRRGVNFDLDGKLADDAGLAGGGHIDGTAGEIDGGARLAGHRWPRPGHLTSPSLREGKLVNISKDQIVQLLESQGNHDKAQQASQQLPDQVDTDNGQHADVLSKLGLDTGSLGNQLGGLGKIL
jgi:hypothetical protein